MWGVDAKDFIPSRWIDENGAVSRIPFTAPTTDEIVLQVKHESQWKFNQFHGGPRLCLGQNLATFEATMIMATITRHFELSFAPGYLEETEMVDVGGRKTPRYANSLTLPMVSLFLSFG